MGSRLFSALVDLRPGEGPVVGGLFLLAVSSGLVKVFILSAAMPIFLERFPLGALPYTYVGAALVSVAAGTLLSRLERRLPFASLLVGSLVFLAGYSLLLRALLALPGPTPAFLTAISVDLVFVINALVLWRLANRVLDIRQAKRLFAPIGSGEVFAGLLGGFAVPWIVSFGGAPSLLVACAASAGLGVGALLWLLPRSTRGQGVEGEGAEASSEPISARLGDRYVLLIVAYSALCTLSYYFVDAGFVAASDARYPDASDLAGFLGFFQAAAALATLAVQLLVIGPLLKRFGVRTYLLVAPAVILAFALAVVLGGGSPEPAFWLMCGTKIVMALTWVSIYPTSKLLVLQPLPAAARSSVQTFTDAIVESVSAGVAGLLLLVLGLVVPFTPINLSVLAAPVLAGLFVAGMAIGARYRDRIASAVTTRALPDASIALADPATLEVLERGLRSELPQEVVYCLEKLEQAAHPRLGELIDALTRHPAPEVRADALLRIERLRPPGALAAVEAMIVSERDSSVRGAALRVLVAFGTDEALERAIGALDEPAPEARAGAMVGLLRYGGLEGIVAAAERLTELIRSGDAGERSLAAQVIGDVGHPGFSRLLRGLLADHDPEVQRAALDAAGRLSSPGLWPAMLGLLTSTTVGSAAAAALVGVGEPVLALLEPTFREAVGPARVALVRVLCAIPGARATEILERAADDPNAMIRARVLRALAERGRRLPVERFEALFEAECALFEWLGATRAAVDGEAAPLLAEALASEVDLLRERVLLLLAVRYESGPILQALVAFTGGSPEERAYALEHLDLSLPARDKERALGLLEGSPRSSAGGVVRPLEETLAAIIERGSLTAWTRACAIHARGPGAGEEDGVLIVEKVLLLRRASIFADTPGHVLARVAEAVEEVVVPREGVLIREGELGSSMFVIAAGTVRIEAGGRILATHGPGDVIGELATLDPQPRTATVTVIEECTLLRLSRGVLFELMAQRVEVAHAIVRFLIRRYKKEKL